MRKWTRRWISGREINDRKRWKQAWRENPEKMLQAQAKATQVARLNKERRRNNLIELFLESKPRQIMDTATLNHSLANFLKTHRRRPSTQKVKALRTRLTRYGVISFDPAELAWKVKIAVV